MNKKYFPYLILIAILGLLQLIRPEDVVQKAPSKELNLPVEVHAILKNSCFDCHSQETTLRWYDQITPINFLVNTHVQEGRKALDFSTFNQKTLVQQKALLFYSLNRILENEMPLSSYALVHPNAKLTTAQISYLKSYLTKLTKSPVTVQVQKDTISKNSVEMTYQKSKGSIMQSPNDIAYIKDWRKWTAISTTERFDNNTLRIIYANKIAIEAIQKGLTHPYPDGSIIAKAAWEQSKDAIGNVSTGKFVQVEFMIKDSQKYASSAGWGWARWKGMNLKPYGKTASFVNECIACHKPVKDNDYVFTLPLKIGRKSPLDILE